MQTEFESYLDNARRATPIMAFSNRLSLLMVNLMNVLVNFQKTRVKSLELTLINLCIAL